MSKSKTGRRASADARAIAGKWVEKYREAQSAPDGRVCLNPDDEHEIQTFIDVHDASILIYLLDSFSKHGTFARVDDYGVERMLLRSEFNVLRADGCTYEEAVAILADRHNCDPRTISRKIQK
jgi:hypothetical protein